MISGEESHLYTYSNNHSKLIQKFSIHRQKGHKKGGQSSHRFMMIHDEQINQYVKHICLLINSHWYNGETGRCMVKGIVIGGIGDIKSKIAKSEHINPKLSSLILSEVSISNFNIEELTHKTNLIINKDKYDKDRKILQCLLDDVTLHNNMYVYGLQEIHSSLIQMDIQSLYIHQKISQNIPDIIERSQENGCDIILLNIDDESSQMFVEGYGGIIAKRWYCTTDDN